MATSEPTEVLLATNRWATQNIIDVCENLASEAFHRRFEMGIGSLHDTLTHILESMQYWTDALDGRDPTLVEGPQQSPPLLIGSFGIIYFGHTMEDQRRKPSELSELLHQIADKLHSLTLANSADETIHWNAPDRTHAFARGAVLTHVTTHGMHHRAQCLNMLRHVGVDPLPATSVHEWMLQVDSAGG